ncbi:MULTISPECIES: type II secretion system F family protein [Pandoraea]|uniref:Toxin coregulated pilus biosynthesis protein E n=2 Tax=Pandoraea TaxID=93217 RepID=A0A5E4XKL3_9BURK|nr:MULTISPECIES: type II secretion system F family protein [Pandoraea]VVE13873.1 Toxin coregulated pilus biosynthesis protein E [Pandoraea cepalis]VVE36826.1 Toxin coregulated pilus biosynthesis protein E [Pandoraea terrigena]
MAKSGGLLTQMLSAIGIRPRAPRKHRILTRKRTGWWGKLSDAADRKAFDWKTREALYMHLASQVENGVSVENALDGFADILRKRKRKSSQALIENVCRRMREGLPLRRAIAIAVPREEAAMIAGGEMSGELINAFDLIVDSHDRVESVIRAYKAAAVRPILYLAMTYGVMWAVGAYVMPSIVQGLPESKVQGLGIVMYKAADLSQSWLSIVPPLVCVALVYAVRFSFPRWVGPHRIKAERYFPYSFYRDIEGYKWLSSFSGLVAAGVPDVHALDRQMETASPWLRERLWHVRFRMTEGGMEFADALEATGANGKLPPFEFPNPAIIDRIRSIAVAKEFHEKVGRLTKRWSVEIERNALSQAKKAGFYAEIGMYALMGFLMYAINGVTTQLGAIGGS